MEFSFINSVVETRNRNVNLCNLTPGRRHLEYCVTSCCQSVEKDRVILCLCLNSIVSKHSLSRQMLLHLGSYKKHIGMTGHNFKMAAPKYKHLGPIFYTQFIFGRGPTCTIG